MLSEDADFPSLEPEQAEIIRPKAQKRPQNIVFFMIFDIFSELVPQYADTRLLSLHRQTNKNDTIMSTRILLICILAGLVSYSTIGLGAIIFQLVGAAYALYYMEFGKHADKHELAK